MPKLSEHSVLHKDQRFMVFEVSQERPFEGYERLLYSCFR